MYGACCILVFDVTASWFHSVWWSNASNWTVPGVLLPATSCVMPVCGVMVSLCVASGVCPGAWFVVVCAPIWIVPVVLLPVACSVVPHVWFAWYVVSSYPECVVTRASWSHACRFRTTVKIADFPKMGASGAPPLGAYNSPT